MQICFCYPQIINILMNLFQVPKERMDTIILSCKTLKKKNQLGKKFYLV